MKKLFRVMFILMIMAMLFANMKFSHVNAAKVKDKSVIDRIYAALDSFEYQKGDYGLNNVILDNLFVGNEIYAYEYKNNDISKLNFSVYPLLYQDELVAFAINDNNKESIDISTEMVNNVKTKIDNCESFALIYDENGCYIYSQKGLKLLCKDKDKSSKGRGKLNMNSSDDKFKNVKLSSYDAVESLSRNFTDDEILQTMVQRYYSCSVSTVLQPNGTDYCWACCVACIGNYVKSQSHSAV